MRVLSCLLLIVAFATFVLCEDCDLSACKPDGKIICIMDPNEYCFTEYKDRCAWNQEKCKNNNLQNHKEYDKEFCDLENFRCKTSKF